MTVSVPEMERITVFSSGDEAVNDTSVSVPETLEIEVVTAPVTWLSGSTVIV